MKKIWFIAIFCFFIANPLTGEETRVRPSSWAQPVTMDGVPNLHQVSANLYLSAQPTRQGFNNLKQMGIKTIVNLSRSFKMSGSNSMKHLVI